jgi:DNA-binding response OmpR family regulator
MARILIVEDDISIAHAYETELVRAGYRVDVANDGISALDTLSADHDMIILDILMPKLDGIGFMQLATHNRPV